jgi:hypothetical protein
MRRYLVVVILVLTVWMGGCAGGPILDNTMILEIQPQPLKRGEKAMATVNAPMDAVEVIGTVRVIGSPQAVFRKDSKQKNWYFIGTIPFSPWVKPGQYTLRAVAVLPEGKKIYTETPVKIQ